MGKAIPFPGGSPKGAGFPSRDIPISAVPRIARICALGLAFDELLDEVCREILALSGADGGCLFLSPRDERSETFSPAAESGTLSDVCEAYRPGPALERLLDRMRTEGRIQADDLSLLPASDPLKRLLDPFPVRSALLTPLRFGTRLLGFVALHVIGRAEAMGGRGAVRDGHGGGDPLRGVGAPPGRGPSARVRSAVPVPHGALPGPHHPSRRDGAHPLRESGVPPDAGGPPGADERLARGGIPPPRRCRKSRRGDPSHGERGEAGRVSPVPDAERRRAVRGRGVVVDPVPGRSGRGPACPPRDPRHLRAKKNGGPPRREPDALHDRDARRRGRPRVQQRPRRDPGRRRASFDARRRESPGPPVPRRDPADGEPRHGVDPAAPGVLPPGEVHARLDPAGARAVGDPPDDTDVPPSGGRALGGMRRCASAGSCGCRPDEAGRDGALPQRRGGDGGRRPALGPHVFRTPGTDASSSRCPTRGPGSTRRRCPASSSRSSPRRPSAGGWGWRRSGGSSTTTAARSGSSPGRGRGRRARSSFR